MSGYAGGTAAADIARLRRMVAEPGTATYTDSLLVTAISNYPLPDVAGQWPLLATGSANTAWTATYDLAATAADIWTEKATAYVGNYDFTADGATFHKQQQYDNATKEARRWASRRSIGTHEMVQYPQQTWREVWIANLAEQDYP